jgi:hypothetical protein
MPNRDAAGETGMRMPRGDTADPSREGVRRAAILDADGRPIAEGCGVHVLALAPGLLTGLDDDDVAFLLTVPGTLAEVDEILDGEVSVQLRESDSTWHFIRSPGHLLRVADGQPEWSVG